MDIQNLSPDELQKLIKDAQAELEAKQAGMRKQVITQIKELAASIGVTVEITDEKRSRKASSSVSAKYANPANSSETWTGRGLAPKWMKALTDQGRNKDEFLIN
ncbi:H-NS histone family protein [Methylomonas sp. LL1]|uniref:H-NS histone family protein n=1 Tax=Methylomonas sp. LL1 TaxID=2785785 RepID=UPI0018C3F8BE|nr:H-NS histone family protein [Methylomonas sp. LL1]QPK62554.1 H-NS histone family protein [Methylomonas sp. LL1]